MSAIIRFTATRNRCCLTWGLLLFGTLAVHAATTGITPAPPAPAPIQSPSLLFSLFRIAGAMAVVIACFFGGVWLFRNWQRLATRGGRAPRLHVLESRSLGPRTGLHVIGYEQQRFLIASAPTGVSMLTALPPGSPEELAAAAPAPLPQIDFASILSKTLALRGRARTTPA